MSGPSALCFGRLCARVGGPALSGGLCVSAQHSLCRAPALSLSGPRAFGWFLCWGLALSLSPSVGARRCLCQGMSGPSAVSGPGGPLPTLSVPGPGGLCVGARRSLCQASVVSVLCRGPALSVSRPGVAFGRFLCRGPALSLYVGARRCLCRGPRCLCQGLALSGGLCVGARRSLCRGAGPGNLCQGLCQGPAVLPQPSLCRASGPPIRSRGPPDQRATHPSTGPQLRSACHPSSPARSLFPAENPKPYCLGETTLYKAFGTF